MLRLVALVLSLAAGAALAAACLLVGRASRIRLPLGGVEEGLSAVGPLRLMAGRVEARGRLLQQASQCLAIGALLQAFAWGLYITAPDN